MNKEIKTYTLDFSEIKYYLEMHAVIRDSLDFPAYYGCNWDAFWDCMKEKAGESLCITIKGLELLERKFPGESKIMLELFTEFKHYQDAYQQNLVRIELVTSSGQTKLL